MADRKNSYYSHGTQEYIHGNTVRKVQPDRIPERKTAVKRQNRTVASYTVRRNQEKALQMNLPFVIMLTIASVCTLYLCVSYLQVQSSITSRIRNIASLESEIETLKSENDALETSINTYVDLDHVYEVATKDLGMVYANKDQVILYNKTESEYVRQYEDIPQY